MMPIHPGPSGMDMVIAASNSPYSLGLGLLVQPLQMVMGAKNRQKERRCDATEGRCDIRE